MTIYLWVFGGNHEACRAVHRAGDSMYWNWLDFIVVATMGYSIDLFTVY